MVDLTQVDRIAFDHVARSYVESHIDQQLLIEQIQTWFEKQLYRYDPCDQCVLTVSLTAATYFEVPGFMTPQYGHVFCMIFENAGDDGKQYYTAELFLRASESHRIIEMCPFRPTLH